jgi:hypothetical protein
VLSENVITRIPIPLFDLRIALLAVCTLPAPCLRRFCELDHDILHTVAKHTLKHVPSFCNMKIHPTLFLYDDAFSRDFSALSCSLRLVSMRLRTSAGSFMKHFLHIAFVSHS